MDKKVVLVSGGSSGIGLEAAASLCDGNYQVISVSRSPEKIARAISSKPEIKGKVDFVVCDASNEMDVKKLYEYIESKYGVLHGLVNNAAILNKGTLESISVSDWEKILHTNLTGPFLMTKYLLPLLKKAEGASVVNISSVAGLKPGTSLSYSVSKSGLDMFTRFLAGDLGPYKIRVNSVNPGLVATNIHLDNKIFKEREAYEEMLSKAANRYPIGYIGEPEDISNMILFLLSDKAKWITGSIIAVDGGITQENDLIPAKK